MEDVREKFEIAVTAIIVRDGKFLITKRSPTKKRYPGMWTVPGGHLETTDYSGLVPNKDGVWYNVLETAAIREVREETGLNIYHIRYVANMALDGKKPVIVVSMTAEAYPGEVSLDPLEATEYAWVSLDEASNYDLIEGIFEELIVAADVYGGLSRN